MSGLRTGRKGDAGIYSVRALGGLESSSSQHACVAPTDSKLRPVCDDEDDDDDDDDDDNDGYNHTVDDKNDGNGGVYDDDDFHDDDPVK
ncbi:hypothetical protein ElyMa_005397600 [Elysia marginata]|uniref:Uncharacterized protein n=1 Tax=Elysia marginata TaxID=1093978 RepID=A0AAV4EHC1_9GAST|nr:hypothetical protein ElyMa_005397600 [Elysia marginata]